MHKDYRIIAQAIKDAETDAESKLAIVEKLCRALLADNERFDSIRFAKACGVM